jgi:hypothetical protein
MKTTFGGLREFFEINEKVLVHSYMHKSVKSREGPLGFSQFLLMGVQQMCNLEGPLSSCIFINNFFRILPSPPPAPPLPRVHLWINLMKRMILI